MGSRSDYAVMGVRRSRCSREFAVPYEVARGQRASHARAHGRVRTRRPSPVGCAVIIAGAGGAAHLPGMIAALTVVPVLGVPVAATALQGLDALAEHRADAQGRAGGNASPSVPQARRMPPCLQSPCWPRAIRRTPAAKLVARRDGDAGCKVLAQTHRRRSHRKRNPRRQPAPLSGSPLLPGATIGIFGGGQLGRMMAMAARGMGYRILVLDPDPGCPARFVVDGQH